MNIKPLSVPRSDLAIELAQSLLKQENTCEKSSKSLPEGLSVHTKKHGSVEITCVKITTPAVAQKLQKPRGRSLRRTAMYRYCAFSFFILNIIRSIGAKSLGLFTTTTFIRNTSLF